jgi:hypothetical protein
MNEPVFPVLSILVALQRRGCATQQNCAAVELGTDDSQVARVIPRSFFLLVGGLVFLVNDDQPEPLNRGEDGASRSDRDAGSAAVEFVPLIVMTKNESWNR